MARDWTTGHAEHQSQCMHRLPFITADTLQQVPLLVDVSDDTSQHAIGNNKQNISSDLKKYTRSVDRCNGDTLLDFTTIGETSTGLSPSQSLLLIVHTHNRKVIYEEFRSYISVSMLHNEKWRDFESVPFV